jgi:CHAT domain-containing protein/Tfp pilus assembly protein PilF
VRAFFLAATFLLCQASFVLAQDSEAARTADALMAEGRYLDALPLAEQALAEAEAENGRTHPDVATAANRLAHLRQRAGDYDGAEALYKRALVVVNRTTGWQSAEAASIQANLATLYRRMGRLEQAEGLYRQALEVAIAVHGVAHAEVATIINNLAVLYRLDGAYRKAEQAYLKAAQILTHLRPADHPDIAVALNNLGSFYFDTGRFEQAERFHRRSLAIKEAAYGDDHPSIATGLVNLAAVYQAQARFDDAEALLLRALDMREARFGETHPQVAATHDALGVHYFARGWFEDAVEPLERAIAAREAVFGDDSLEAARSLVNLAAVHLRLDDHAAAEAVQMRALAAQRKAYGPDHVIVGTALNNLAEIHRETGDIDSAEVLHGQVLAIRRASLGEDHPDIAHSWLKLALVAQDRGDIATALDHIREATAIHRHRATLPAATATSPVEEHGEARDIFARHLDLIEQRLAAQPPDTDALLAEAFEVVQLAAANRTAATVARMAARFGAGDGALAALVRERQDMVERWNALDKRLLKAMARAREERDEQAEADLRTELAVTGRAIRQLDRELAESFPDYAELVSMQPLSLADATGFLGADEALLVYLVDAETSFLLVLRKTSAALHRIMLGAEDIAELVGDLRSGLDATGVSNLDSLPEFDLALAYEIFAEILAPAMPDLAGVEHLLVQPAGALDSLPFALLVQDEPKDSDYRAADWLIRDFALSVLPSVGSLQALRQLAPASAGDLALIAFGDPLLDGAPGPTRGAESAALFQQGSGAVEAIRRLPRLPDTADELRALASAVGAGPDALHLGAGATETAVRAAPLSEARIIAFATHGLVAGEFDGMAEPALVLTPPQQASADDDGLLTASEVTELKLDADWVILSACNTAAADGTPGADGLSGLAKAFFYAGGRALLVSHWSVFSDAARALTTGTFRALQADPSLRRSGALRAAMLEMLDDAERPHWAHPIFWSPFVVVGES